MDDPAVRADQLGTVDVLDPGPVLGDGSHGQRLRRADSGVDGLLAEGQRREDGVALLGVGVRGRRQEREHRQGADGSGRGGTNTHVSPKTMSRILSGRETTDTRGWLYDGGRHPGRGGSAAFVQPHARTVASLPAEPRPLRRSHWLPASNLISLAVELVPGPPRCSASSMLIVTGSVSRCRGTPRAPDPGWLCVTSHEDPFVLQAVMSIAHSRAADGFKL